MQTSLIGVPTNSAGKRGGVAKAPAALRRAGLAQALGRSCRDEGDVPFDKPATAKRDPDSGIIAYGSLASMIRGVRASVSHALQEGRFPVVVGGDCPVLLGCLAGFADVRGTPKLLFVDGHEDADLPWQSPTGEAADMELAIALGISLPEMVWQAAGSLPLVKASNVCMLGPRDKKLLEKSDIGSLDGLVEYYDDAAVRKGDIKALARKVLGRLAPAGEKLWLHVDLDVLSTKSLPAVDYRQPGGLSWGQLETLTRAVLSSGSVIGMDVTIYNPDMDPDGRYAKRIVKYLQDALA